MEIESRSTRAIQNIERSQDSKLPRMECASSERGTKIFNVSFISLLEGDQNRNSRPETRGSHTGWKLACAGSTAQHDN